MERTIEYGDDIIVGVKHHGNWHWYLSEKELWFLDGRKFLAAFEDDSLDGLEDDRFGIEVVDEHSADDFLRHMRPNEVSTADLRNLLLRRLPIKPGEDVIEYQPSLLVDFDAKRVQSRFYEPASFEHYVPDSWSGEYRDFLEDVPNEQRYWIVDDRNLLLDPPTETD